MMALGLNPMEESPKQPIPQEKFDDFDFVVEQVAKNPVPAFSQGLL